MEDGDLMLEATASSGLEVVFEINQGPASVDGNTLSFSGLGTVIVIATQQGNDNYLSADPVEQSIEIITITGLKDVNTTKLTCYPNPASQSITLEFDPALESARIVNVYGLTVYEKTQINALAGKLEIDVSKYKAGEYIILMANDERTESQKVLIVK